MNRRKKKVSLKLLRTFICMLFAMMFAVATPVESFAAETYMSWSGINSYIAQSGMMRGQRLPKLGIETIDGDNKTVQVAYCFNKNKALPAAGEMGVGVEGLGGDWFQMPFELTYKNATNDQFLATADNELTTKYWFKNAVLWLIYNGFPYNNYSNDKTGKSFREYATDYYGIPEAQADDFLRTATQLAIWSYTDNPREDDKQYVPWNYTYRKNHLPGESGYDTHYDPVQHLAAIMCEAAYDRSSNPPADFELDIYSPVGGSAQYPPQNLLAVRMYEKSKIDLYGSKRWEDVGNEDKRPAVLQLELRGKTTKEDFHVQDFTTGIDGNWNYSFLQMDGYKDGMKISYYVVEHNVPLNYKLVSSDGMNVVNRYEKPRKVYDGSFTLSKSVTGSFGNAETQFRFDLIFANEDGSKLDEDCKQSLKVTTYTNGAEASRGVPNLKDGTTYSLRLSHNQTIKIEGLPTNYKITIVEDENSAAGYKTFYSVNDGEKKLSENRSLSLNGSSLSVVCENKRDAIVDTGLQINNDMWISLVGISMLIILLSGGFIYKRNIRKRKEF